MSRAEERPVAASVRERAPAALGPEAAPALLLLTGTPREILARIVPGDPLGLRAALAGRLRARALIGDADGLLLRAFALVAYRAGGWRGRPALERWLASRVDEAIDGALADESAAQIRAPLPDGPVRAGAPRPAPAALRDDVYARLGAPLGLEAGALRGASARYNRLPACEREAFFLLVIDGEPLQRACARSARSAAELARAARRALSALDAPSVESPEPGRTT